MQQIKTKDLTTNILLYIFYVILSFITAYVTNDGLHAFLIWNLTLAVIPYAIAYLIDQKIINTKVGIIIALLLWLFFFPNSVYIITDLIYVNINDFVLSINGYNPTEYLQDISSYLGLFHIFIGAILGLVYGYKSLSVLYNLSKKTVVGKYRDLLVVLVFFLSAVGIYIGRFFRYNSWDIFKIFDIIKDFFSTFSWFTVFFILTLTMVQLVIFLAVKINFVKNENIKE